jgi:hypothetical protein
MRSAAPAAIRNQWCGAGSAKPTETECAGALFPHCWCKAAALDRTSDEVEL